MQDMAVDALSHGLKAVKDNDWRQCEANRLTNPNYGIVKRQFKLPSVRTRHNKRGGSKRPVEKHKEAGKTTYRGKFFNDGGGWKGRGLLGGGLI